jgi:hypothetical protein
VASAYRELAADRDNWAAWRLFCQVSTRFAVEMQCANHVLERLTAGLDDWTFADRLERVAVIYDAISPEKESA